MNDVLKPEEVFDFLRKNFLSSPATPSISYGTNGNTYFLSRFPLTEVNGEKVEQVVAGHCNMFREPEEPVGMKVLGLWFSDKGILASNIDLCIKCGASSKNIPSWVTGMEDACKSFYEDVRVRVEARVRAEFPTMEAVEKAFPDGVFGGKFQFDENKLRREHRDRALSEIIQEDESPLCLYDFMTGVTTEIERIACVVQDDDAFKDAIAERVFGKKREMFAARVWKRFAVEKVKKEILASPTADEKAAMAIHKAILSSGALKSAKTFKIVAEVSKLYDNKKFVKELVVDAGGLASMGKALGGYYLKDSLLGYKDIPASGIRKVSYRGKAIYG